MMAMLGALGCMMFAWQEMMGANHGAEEHEAGRVVMAGVAFLMGIFCLAISV